MIHDWQAQCQVLPSRAPAQTAAPEPTAGCHDAIDGNDIGTDRQAAVRWMKRAESAESQLAAVRKILQQAPDTQDPDPDELEAIVDAFSDVRDALTTTPSPGAGGGK
jgi:hypothetical protein